jgi:hypothetical protein
MGAPDEMKSMMKGENMGQVNQPSGTQGAAGTQPANVSPAAKGGDATVARVDRSGNCLRVRSDPSASSKEIACVAKGEKVHLTGLFSKDGRWAQLDNQGWVFFNRLSTDVKPPQTASMGKSWERSAGTGTGKHSTGRHHYRGTHCCYPGYYYYFYPGYYGWY